MHRDCRFESYLRSQQFNLGRPEGLPFCFMFWVYILENPSSTFYVGQTANLAAAWLIIIEPTASTDITLGRMDLGILFGPRLMNREALPFVVKSKSNA